MTRTKAKKVWNIGWGLITLTLCLTLNGCSKVEYYPLGVGQGGTIPFINSPKPFKCDKCKKDTYLYKVDSKKRIVCDECFRKIR